MTQRLDKRKRERENLAADDAALFDKAMRDVDRYTHRSDPPKQVVHNRLGKHKSNLQTNVKARPPPARQPQPLPVLSAGASPDIDARTMDRLRRGQMRPEARLDPHGLTQNKAHAILSRFIADSQSAGLRCVMVITGKGRVSEGGGVLRNRVPQWLNAPELRPRILAFTAAQQRDGGTGALYILLRRVR